MNDKVTFTEIGPHIGSEVRGLDLGQPVSDETLARIKRELADRAVLVLHGQENVTPEQHIAFSRRLGPLEDHVLQDFCLPGHPEIFVVSNIIENGRHIGAYGGSKEYHSDLAYLPEPSYGSVFRCVECTEEGGETAFINMAAAYDALPESEREWLAGQCAVHDYAWHYERAHTHRPPLTEAQKAKTPPVVHPAVRTIPENGRRAIFLSEIWVRRFEGLEDEASQRRVADILDIATRPEFTYVHKWTPGDVVIWDNRNSMHKACPFDEEGGRRLMHRTTIKGDRPFFDAAA